MRLAFCAIAALLVVALPLPANGQDLDASAPQEVNGCVESIPSGATRPEISDEFPERGTSGHAASLVVTVEHGKGESVLPNGLQVQSAGEAARTLKDAEFVIPEQDASAGARLEKAGSSKPDRATTRLELPLVPLPKQPGRHTLRLPPLPIVVARASGELMTVCTKPHTIVVEDPIANTPDAKPRDNPPPRPQWETWEDLKKAAVWIALGVAAGVFLAYVLYKYLRRPKPVPPPPPPRPPWEVALEKLDEVRHAGLLETGRFADYFDRVNDAVRNYLGARYGFDGLESTSDEIMAALAKVPHFAFALPEIRLFLQDCDLVKFANMIPTNEDCKRALEAGERIVRSTMPVHQPAPAPRADATEIHP